MVSLGMPFSRRWLALLLLAGFSACGGAKVGRGQKKVVAEDFAEGRVVDVSITEKLTGAREMLFMSMPQKTMFLEGYIQGVITDYADNPIQGVVVRAVAAGEAQREETGERRGGFAGSSFDPGVSDTNGFYRIRFSLPLINNVVDVRGRILFSPGWEQERDNLGRPTSPNQAEPVPGLLRAQARLIFAEGIRKNIVAPVTSAAAAGRRRPPPSFRDLGRRGAPAAAGAEGGAGEEDLFKGFGFGI